MEILQLWQLITTSLEYVCADDWRGISRNVTEKYDSRHEKLSEQY